jgi:hypothetical protein
MPDMKRGIFMVLFNCEYPMLTPSRSCSLPNLQFLHRNSFSSMHDEHTLIPHL